MSEMPFAPWSAALLAATVSALTLGVLDVWRSRLPQDHPTDRSLHDRPVSRAGGIAIWAGFLPVAMLGAAPMAHASIVLAAWAAVTAISIADDWRGVRPAVRLGVHALAAVAVAAALLRPDAFDGPTIMRALAMAAAALVFVWSANLFNFMDGSDGLAAVTAICGFGAYGVAAMFEGAPAETYFALAGATLPFFIVNVPPARTFMGDGGSIPLGFLAAVFGFSGIRTGTWPAWFPLLVFLPVIADTTLTMMQRIAHGEHLFEPHKTHYYQRLHRLGAGHTGTLLFFGVLIAGTSASALFTLKTEPAAGWRVLGAWAVAVGVLFAGIDYHWRKKFPGPR
jgi:UDP-N-acetylmuramyl pentapeptide phosphotransferase/UDP-N-acetylglucosamine-1-phosphate transferase